MDCNMTNGTYRCTKPARHIGPHACYVLGSLATWGHMYDEVKFTRVKL